jgi:hypothetical protein
VTRKLRRELVGYVVTTVQGAGFSGYTNGRLLKRLEGDYDVLITMDGSMPSQQLVAAYKIGVIVLRARSNRIADLKPLTPQILAAIAAITLGQLVHIPP